MSNQCTADMSCETVIGALKISNLINSVFFFINYAFILNKGEAYRLVAAHKGEVLFDKSYRTLRGARIAFARMYRDRGWKRDIKPEWSHFYVPDKHWVKAINKRQLAEDHRLLKGFTLD
jgi:hypothetical protein